MFFHSMGCRNMRPEELNEKLKAGEDLFLLDVRTPQENAVHAIEGSYLIPLNELSYRVQEIPKNKEIVVYCRIGSRSSFACSYLSRLGYKVNNLEGGIVLWNLVGNASMAQA
jgi:rhodanese-related sulfurtransferase